MLGEDEAGLEVFSLSIHRTHTLRKGTKSRRRSFLRKLEEANELPGWDASVRIPETGFAERKRSRLG